MGLGRDISSLYNTVPLPLGGGAVVSLALMHHITQEPLPEVRYLTTQISIQFSSGNRRVIKKKGVRLHMQEQFPYLPSEGNVICVSVPLIHRILHTETHCRQRKENRKHLNNFKVLNADPLREFSVM